MTIKFETTPLDPIEFIRTHTDVIAPPLVPELRLHLAAENSPFWQMNNERLRQLGDPPAFWAFAWPGGQGMARYLLDHPVEVRGKHILDIGAGSGIGGIAAMKAGAASVIAVDIDPMAHVAVQQNAALNGVKIESKDYVKMDAPPKKTDIIIASDVCYEQAMAAQIVRWLWLCVDSGLRVIMSDTERAYVPKSGLTELAAYTVTTLRAIELNDSRTVHVWDVGLPELE